MADFYIIDRAVIVADYPPALIQVEIVREIHGRMISVGCSLIE